MKSPLSTLSLPTGRYEFSKQPKLRNSGQAQQTAGGFSKPVPQFDSWRDWFAHFFPKYAEFAPHHEEFWDWVWKVRKGVQPDSSFISIWPRGGGKSSSIELACVLLGAMLARRYIVYISGTQPQATDHVGNVAGFLETPSIKAAYPELSQRLANQYGQSKGWRASRIRTASGLTIDAFGLDVAIRGAKLDDERPDLIVFDDVDDMEDSDEIIEKKIRTLTRSIFPSGSDDFAVLGCQNLIHRNSIFSRMADGRAEFLMDREVSGPVPALRGFDYEKTGTFANGKPKYVITAGTPTWAGMDIERCTAMLNKFSPAAFLAECQQDVSIKLKGAIYPEWDEIYHVITWSEFAKTIGAIAYDEHGVPRIPKGWNLARSQDWGATVPHPCVTIWAARPGKLSPYKDSVFIYRELVRPIYPSKGEPDEPNTPLRIGRLINERERKWKEREYVKMSLASHEAKSERDTYQFDLPEGERLHFVSWGTDKRQGLAQVRQYLQLDQSREHPFRRHPATGERLMGRPRLYLIVEDEQGSLELDNEGELAVQPASDELGLRRLRDEFPEYHYRTRSGGEEVNEPYALFNDAMDPLRCLASRFFPQPAQAEPEAVAAAAFAEKYPDMVPGKILDLDEASQGVAVIAAMAKFQEELRKAQQGAGVMLNPRYQDMLEEY